MSRHIYRDTDDDMLIGVMFFKALGMGALLALMLVVLGMWFLHVGITTLFFGVLLGTVTVALGMIMVRSAFKLLTYGIDAATPLAVLNYGIACVAFLYLSYIAVQMLE